MLLAVRPWSFTITFVSVTVGSLLALTLQSEFNIALYLLVLIAMIIVHAATNLINDYFDVKHGVDRVDSPTAQYRPHPVLTGEMKPKHALYISLGLFAVAALIGFYLYTLLDWPIAALALAGGAASFFYTGGPIKYKYLALGEISVFLMWGPLMLLGSYFVQTGNWEYSADLLLISIPIGTWVALVLIANNLKDIEYDRVVGVKTIATILDRDGTFVLYATLMFQIYFLFLLEAIFDVLPLPGLIVLLTIPLSLKLLKTLRTADEIPPDADPKTAQLATLTGLLLIISLLADHIIKIYL
jgi:1,4-dihydroxy-2-naphthoate octaprenyltransferase